MTNSRLLMMKKYMNKKLAVFLFFLMGICVHPVAPAGGYLLKGSHLLDIMIEKLSGPQTLMVTQKVIIPSATPEEAAIHLDETIRYLHPKAFRSDIQSEYAHRIHVVANGQSLTVLDGKITADSETDFDLYKDLFLYNSRAELEERLYTLGVNVAVTSLGRLDGNPAYVVGAQYPDEMHPQLWVDKDAFTPLRWIIMGRTENGTVNAFEIRYHGWRQWEKTWYPGRIEIIRNGNLEREIIVGRLDLNPVFNDAIFDLQQLRSAYEVEATTSQTETEPDSLDEVQQSIQDFKKIFEH